MKTEIEVRLVRLASARGDMLLADSAYHYLRIVADDDLRYHVFTSMVIAYCRPFGPNTGIRNLAKEYAKYPDWPDKAMNLRHTRMMDLRKKFLAHSSTEGTKVRIIPKGAINPRTGLPEPDNWYDVAKRMFSYSHYGQFADWLHEVIVALKDRVNKDMLALLPQYLAEHPDKKEVFEVDTGADQFQWTIPKDG